MGRLAQSHPIEHVDQAPLFHGWGKGREECEGIVFFQKIPVGEQHAMLRGN